ncbi:MAG: aminotransferase class V-fold PLP-dependent enzyme, partial [Pseudomonadota bacterium]
RNDAGCLRRIDREMSAGRTQRGRDLGEIKHGTIGPMYGRDRCQCERAIALVGNGVIPLDVSEVDPDFVVFPTYKWLLGPYGRAFLYIAPRHQAGMPLEQTASGRRRITSDATIYLQDTDHVADARRFDMGQRDYFVTMEMASVGIEYVSHLGASEVAAYTKRLTDQAAEALPERLIPKTASRAPHILSLQVEPDRAKDIETTLASDQIFVSARLGRLRLSPHVYNEPRDIERFVSKLRPLLN